MKDDKKSQRGGAGCIGFFGAGLFAAVALHGPLFRLDDQTVAI
jgi:hypothetical protein